MGTVNGSTSQWVEDGSMSTHWLIITGSRIALLGHTLDQHPTGLRQVEVG